MKRALSILLAVTAVFCVFVSCTNVSKTVSEETTPPLVTKDAGEAGKQAETEETAKKEADEASAESAKAETAKKQNETTKENEQMDYPRVLVKMENGGEFTIELYPQFAPKTVENFLKLVGEGFYDGLTFHRVYKGFMAQGGDPKGNGTGGSDETIFGEFASNGFTQNVLSHSRGVISMARSAQNDSASSQFFICYSDACCQLDGSYAAFGKVVDGMEVVDAFCDNKMTFNSMGEMASPVEPIYIKTMTEIK